MKTNISLVVKPIRNITGVDINTKTPKVVKEKFVNCHLDQTKYLYLGCVDRSNMVILMARYHNVRDSKGRFASVSNS